MTTIYRERTARVPHRCAWECGVPIKPGERYVMSSLTPNDVEIGNIGWWHAALHGRNLYECPNRHAWSDQPPGEDGLRIDCAKRDDEVSGS